MVSLCFLGVTGFKQWCLFILGVLLDLNSGVSLGVLSDLNSGVSPRFFWGVLPDLSSDVTLF